MTYNIDGIYYDIIIVKKNNKNIYIRVKEDLKIYITCNYLTTNKVINRLLIDNEDFIRKSIERVKSNNKDDNKLYYLGNSYDIIIKESIDNVEIKDGIIYIKDKNMLDKWYKNEIINVFDERYVIVFNRFKENVKSPILKIRNMKSRWGVYNRKNHTITLNSKLIEFDIEKIDYVILHELSHIIYFNHSKDFWNLVNKYCPNYKEIRKEMK